MITRVHLHKVNRLSSDSNTSWSRFNVWYAISLVLLAICNDIIRYFRIFNKTQKFYSFIAINFIDSAQTQCQSTNVEKRTFFTKLIFFGEESSKDISKNILLITVNVSQFCWLYSIRQESWFWNHYSRNCTRYMAWKYAIVNATERLATTRSTWRTATSTRDILASRWCALRASRLYHVKLDRS